MGAFAGSFFYSIGGTMQNIVLFSVQRDPLAFVFEKDGHKIVVPISTDLAQVLAWELLQIPAVAGNFNQIAEEFVLQKLQNQQTATLN
jgi:hypothetical protein